MNEQLLQKTQPGQKTKPSVPRYVRLWEKIRATETKLNHQEAINETVLRQFAAIIRPLEENLTHELSELTRDLIGFFHNEDSDAHRSLFGFWIIDNFATLASHPFATRHKVEELFDLWRLPLQGTDDMVEAQLSLLMAGRGDLPGQQHRRANYPDADLFADSNSNNPSTSNNASHSPNSSGANKADNTVRESDASTDYRSARPNADDQAGESTHKASKGKHTGSARKKTKTDRGANANSDGLGELFNIETLFRRIARIVHPDREQDEEKKAEKHAIMSTCLKARASEDIAQLLTLYAVHVGNLPDNWSNESTGDLVIALEEQLRALEARSLKLQSQDPLLQLIQNRYLSFDMRDVNTKIDRHKDGLTIEITLLKQRRDQLKTDEGLIDALEERRDIEMDKLVVADLTS